MKFQLQKTHLHISPPNAALIINSSPEVVDCLVNSKVDPVMFTLMITLMDNTKTTHLRIEGNKYQYYSGYRNTNVDVEELKANIVEEGSIVMHIVSVPM